MKPDIGDIIESVIWSLETYVRPDLKSDFSDSVIKTTLNLLRHVSLRSRLNFPIVFEDVEDLRGLLRDSVKVIRPILQAKNLECSEISRLHDVDFDKEISLSKNYLAELEIFRDFLDLSLESFVIALNGLDADIREVPEYVVTRRRIREYFSRRLSRDALVVDEAFVSGRR